MYNRETWTYFKQKETHIFIFCRNRWKVRSECHLYSALYSYHPFYNPVVSLSTRLWMLVKHIRLKLDFQKKVYTTIRHNICCYQSIKYCVIKTSKHLRRKAWAKFSHTHIHRRQSWRMKAILMLNVSLGRVTKLNHRNLTKVLLMHVHTIHLLVFSSKVPSSGFYCKVMWRCT